MCKVELEDEILEELLNCSEDEDFPFGDPGLDDWDEEDDDFEDEDIDDDDDFGGLDVDVKNE